MTGYTVHTGASKDFSEGWDRIFSSQPKKNSKGGAKKSKTEKSSKASASKSKKKSPQSGKTKKK